MSMELKKPAEEIREDIGNIVRMANAFQNKKLPDWAVGSIDGWCRRLGRLADQLEKTNG